MAQIQVLDELKKRYKLWTIQFERSTDAVRKNILQTGSGKDIQERLVSFGMASLVVYIGSSIIGFFGFYTGGFFSGVVLFAIGWSLSKLFNKRFFGNERKESELKEDEMELLNYLNSLVTTHKKIRGNIIDNPSLVFFTDYPNLRKAFVEAKQMLENYNTNHLAYKYRMKHAFIIKKYANQIYTFDAIYANKKRGRNV